MASVVDTLFLIQFHESKVAFASRSSASFSTCGLKGGVDKKLHRGALFCITDGVCRRTYGPERIKVGFAVSGYFPRQSQRRATGGFMPAIKDAILDLDAIAERITLSSSRIRTNLRRCPGAVEGIHRALSRGWRQ